MMAGYSGTPLAKKLGFREGTRGALVGAPVGFRNYLGELPRGAKLLQSPTDVMDLILLFTKTEPHLKRNFVKLASRLSPAGMLWVAWPKKSSGVSTDLSFSVVQNIGLDAGLVDTKICAVDEVWSGLRFVRRLKDRN